MLVCKASPSLDPSLVDHTAIQSAFGRIERNETVWVLLQAVLTTEQGAIPAEGLSLCRYSLFPVGDDLDSILSLCSTVLAGCLGLELQFESLALERLIEALPFCELELAASTAYT